MKKTNFLWILIFLIVSLLAAVSSYASTKYILPGDGVQGFEYSYPEGTEIAQQADPNFDGWAILGSNVSRKAALEYNSRKKNHFIQVYSGMGLRADGSKGSTVLSKDFAADGVMVIEFDLNFYDGVGNVSLKNTGATNWKPGHTAISLGVSQRDVVVTDGIENRTLVENLSELKWYSFKIITNVDTKRYSIKAYDGKTLIAELNDLEYAITDGVQATGIRNINVFLPDQAADKRINFDNVLIYNPEVSKIELKAAGSGVQIPESGCNKIQLTAGAFDKNGLIIPGSSFSWSLAEEYAGVHIKADNNQPNKAVLVVQTDAAAKPVTVMATAGGSIGTAEVDLINSGIEIEISGQPEVLIPFTTKIDVNYSAIICDSHGTILSDEIVTWHLYDHRNLDPIALSGVELDSETGVLTIYDTAQPAEFRLRAVLDFNPQISKDYGVVIYGMKYDFGASNPVSGYVKITPDTFYSEDTGFGIDPHTPVRARVIDEKEPISGDYLYADSCFRFQQKLPPGNYRIKAVFADTAQNNVSVGVENVPTQRFRSSEIYDNHIMKGTVRFNSEKSAELVFDVAVVDGVLDIDFIGNLVNKTQYKAVVNALEITKLPTLVDSERHTLFIAGDSTAANYSAGDLMAGWGQMLGEFLGTNFTVNNRAIGGRSSASFYRDGRLEEILLNIRPGDYLLIQFGHNDGSFNKAERYCGNDDYEMLYAQYYIKGAKQRGAVPIVVTSVPMYGFSSTATLGTYVESAKRIAEQTNTLLIDLHNDALNYYNNLPGTQKDKEEVVKSYYILDKKGGRDFTHFTHAGARKMAELIYMRMKELDLVP